MWEEKLGSITSSFWKDTIDNNGGSSMFFSHRARFGVGIGPERRFRIHKMQREHASISQSLTERIREGNTRFRMVQRVQPQLDFERKQYIRDSALEMELAGCARSTFAQILSAMALPRTPAGQVASGNEHCGFFRSCASRHEFWGCVAVKTKE